MCNVGAQFHLGNIYNSQENKEIMYCKNAMNYQIDKTFEIK